MLAELLLIVSRSGLKGPVAGPITVPPPPISGAGGEVQHQSSHEDMSGPEHQICLSKDVTGRYVLQLDLADRPSGPSKDKSHLDGGLLVVRSSCLEVDLFPV